MKLFLFALLLLYAGSLNAQHHNSENRLYQDYAFTDDSLVMSGGVNPKEFSLLNLKKEFHYDYYRHIFTRVSSGDYSKTKHWSVPIKIYLDSKIPKDVQDDFIQFVTFLPKIEKLTISFVRNKKESNFYIYPVTEKLDDFELDFYKGITFSLLTDESNKFYGGRILFNPNQLKDNTVLKTKLRQFFFASLGNFCIRNELGTDSLLSENYQWSRTISNYDYTILRFHYGLYNKNAIGYPELKKLLQKIQSTTFTNTSGKFTLTL
ncbi:hypothetical protein FSS13T_18260 [Flavobacterium saliperosum S13]|uniref:Uncharacterized protein n=2 Tax=Flavobacterium saliperosum TaxID=329186 RepID=A0A1G4VK57_9FLAO|nr:hypothetical protein [Flavobacterium saliperosum]ESU25589.1 hypothetical protein FSS13T_18260 [Flavobacterium saliperosum S13]SCX07989.1 hypothetical protein SAMN02927925_01268 [Flavobacterium saliperosum]